MRYNAQRDDDMDYMTVNQAAKKWDVSSRWVQALLKSNRINEAVRLSRDWMIPANAQKPGDPRLEKKRPPTQSSLQAELDRVLDVSSDSGPRDDPYGFLDAIKEKKIRKPTEAILAYLRGDFEYVKRCYKESDGDDVLKLLISPLSIAASISDGDHPFYLETEKWLKEIIDADLGAGVTAYAQLSLAIGYLGGRAPDMASEWIKNGDFSNLHPHIRSDATIRRIEYMHITKRYESMLDTAQALISLRCLPDNELSGNDIILRTRCAIACHYLGRETEAKSWLTGAMDIALPHGFITPFTETALLMGGLTERCVREYYPYLYDSMLEQSARTAVNWVMFHNRFTKDNITRILTLQEFEIAALVVRHVSREKIAEHFNYSKRWVNKKIETIYSKLLINNKNELEQYIII